MEGVAEIEKVHKNHTLKPSGFKLQKAGSGGVHPDFRGSQTLCSGIVVSVLRIRCLEHNFCRSWKSGRQNAGSACPASALGRLCPGTERLDSDPETALSPGPGGPGGMRRGLWTSPRPVRFLQASPQACSFPLRLGASGTVEEGTWPSLGIFSAAPGSGSSLAEAFRALAGVPAPAAFPPSPASSVGTENAGRLPRPPAPGPGSSPHLQPQGPATGCPGRVALRPAAAGGAGSPRGPCLQSPLNRTAR